MRAVALVPLFNHGRTIVGVLESIEAHGLPIIVVDDGSTDDGAACVRAWTASRTNAELICLPRNQGKSAALRVGMSRAHERGFTHALTMDADGQHDASCIPAFLVSSSATDAATLIIGNRTPLPPDYPLHRLCGRVLSGLAVRAASGVVVGDAASGMRLWPIEPTLHTAALGGRYAWEEEIIIRLAWNGVVIRDVPIPVIYIPHAISPSHYRFGRDWTEGFLVLTACMIARCVDPRAAWRGGRDTLRTLLWPLASESNSLMAALLALVAFAVGCTVTSCVTLAAPTSVATSITWATALALVWAAWRMRVPMAVVAIAITSGALLPPALCGVLSLSAIALVPVAIGRQRSRHEQAADRGAQPIEERAG